MVKEQLLVDMKECYQFIDSKKGVRQTIYGHGISVASYCLDLIMHIYTGKVLDYDWDINKISDCNIVDIIKKLLILNVDHEDYSINDIDMEEIINDIGGKCEMLRSILTYCLYHDCGKPYCRTVDCNGNTHFFNHESVSHKKWMEYDGNKFIGDLILYDMVLHRSTVKELDDIFENISHIQWIILVLSALSEVHSNANMFGGIESVSFKIKLKKVLKNIKHIIKKITCGKQK